MTLLFLLFLFQASAETDQPELSVWVQKDIVWLNPPTAAPEGNTPGSDTSRGFTMPKLGSAQILIWDHTTYILVLGWVSQDQDGTVVWLEREGFSVLIGQAGPKQMVFTSSLEHPLDPHPLAKAVDIKQQFTQDGTHLQLDETIFENQNTSDLIQSAARLVNLHKKKGLLKP